MLRLNNDLKVIALLLTPIIISVNCTSNRSYTRDYTVNRSARSSSIMRQPDRGHDRTRVKESYTRKRRSSASRNTSARRSARSTVVSTEAAERSRLVDYASRYLGKPYRFGGKSPSTGFDCSGLIYYTYKHFDYAINNNSRAQAQQGRKIPLGQCSAGDLLFFGSKGNVNHVALVANNDGPGLMIIHSTTSAGVIMEDYYKSKYWQNRFLFARRIVGVVDSDDMANR